MRTTVDMPADLHLVIASLATRNRKRPSQAAGDLMRLGPQDRASLGVSGAATTPVDPVTGLPLVRLMRVVAAGPAGVAGHRQVTDACLAGLARHHGGRLLTLDRGLAALHRDVAVVLARA